MSPKTDLLPITDMLDVAERAVRHITGTNVTQLVQDEVRSDAVLRVIGVLGEAANRVSEPTRRRFPGLPWKQMRGMRNIVIHNYDSIDWQTVWEVAAVHIPAMLPDLRAAHAVIVAEEPPPPAEVP